MPTIREFVEEATNSRSTSRLEELGVHRSTSVRVAVAENTSSPDGLILRLSRDADELVRLSAAGNVRNRPHIHDSLAHSDDKWVRAILAHTFARDDDRSLSYSVQRQLAIDDFWEVRQRIAETTNYSDLFDSCLADVHPRVRGASAANPRISREQMDQLLVDRQWQTRSIAIQMGLRFPDDEQLIRGARDKSAAVRWAVLFRVDRPREAVELIALDSDDINRQHAESMLAGDPHMSDQVVTSARDDRARAARGLSFDPPPTL